MTGPAPDILDLLKTPDELLGLEPDELGAILVQVGPSIGQAAGFSRPDIVNRLYPFGQAQGNRGYPEPSRGSVEVALAEAMSWLESNGLIVSNPSQQAGYWFLLTRRAAKIETLDLDAYKIARTLPKELLRADIEQKVRSLYSRGDYDTAIFQAFKMVEMFVRKAANQPPELPGQAVMRNAFRPAEKGGPGPLTTRICRRASNRPCRTYSRARWGTLRIRRAIET